MKPLPVRYTRISLGPARRTLVLLLAAGTIAGCGGIVNKDRIVIATIDGESVTRGGLAEILRDMPNEDRPLIQTKSDLLRALNAYLDERVKISVTKELVDAQKISINRQRAVAAYFEKFPERYRYYTAQNPTEATLQRMGITVQELIAVKADMEFGIDTIEERLLREVAIDYLVREAKNEESIELSDADYRAELDARGGTMTSYEYVFIHAILFPARFPDAVTNAAEARRRADEEESFEDVAASYHNKPTSTTIRVGIENDPNSEKFRALWDVASGSGEGDILGPVFLPPIEEISEFEGGRTRAKRIEQSHAVIKVLEHAPQFEMDWAQVKEALYEDVLRNRIMKDLRAQHGVQIYEDKLPDPAGFGDQFKNSMIKTGRPDER